MSNHGTNASGYDPVTAPEHYTRDFGIEPKDFLGASWMAPGGMAWQIVTYVCRFQWKNGVQDLLKARTYLDDLIEWARRNLPDGMNV